MPKWCGKHSMGATFRKGRRRGYVDIGDGIFNGVVSSGCHRHARKAFASVCIYWGCAWKRQRVGWPNCVAACEAVLSYEIALYCRRTCER